jgi:general secretion pathway protein C
MLTSIPAAWTVRGTSFALWALAGASTVAWGIKLSGNPHAVTLPPPTARQAAPVDPAALARLLGGTPAAAGAPMAAPSLASHFHLLGVAAGAHSGQGAAVISIDGKPARSYRVGSTLEEGIVLQAVHGREAELGAPGRNEPMVVLQVPALKMESVQGATLPPGAASTPMSAPAPMTEPAPAPAPAPAAAAAAAPAPAPATATAPAPAPAPAPITEPAPSTIIPHAPMSGASPMTAPAPAPGTAPMLSPRARAG